MLVSAVDNPPAVVVVEGEAGIGKTRLISELQARPEVADRTFVVGTCRRIREPFPLGPVLDVVKDVGPELTASRLSPVVGALRPLLPEVAHLLPPQPSPLDDRDAERHRVFRGLVEVLTSLDPAVLVLEDLHWADDHTLDFVAYLVADPPPMFSLVLTYREDEAAPHVRALTAKLAESVTRTHVSLPPLDAQLTSELTAAILGVERVSDEFAEHLCERASGLPFAIEELLALLQARGTLVRRGGGWERKDLDELDVPTGIRDPVLERVSRLSDDARSVLEAAAVLQSPVSADVLVATCQAARARVRRGLEEALECGLLVEHGNAVGFRHLLAAQAVYEAVPGIRRQDLHRQAAAALDSVPGPPLGQVAHHLRYAGRLTEWAEAAERAADQAADLGHHDETARLLEDVLSEVTLDPPQQGRIAVKLGRAASESLRPVEGVAGLLSDVLDEDLPQVVRGELRLLLGFLLERTGVDFRVQRALYAQAADDLADRPDLMAHAMVTLAFPCVPGIALSEHKRWMQRILEVVPAVEDPVWQVFLLGKVAMVQVAIGDRQWRHMTDRITARSGGTPRQGGEVGAYQSIGHNACYAGHLEVAGRLLKAGLEGAIASEIRRREVRIRAAGALLDFCRGAWDGLADRAETLIDQLADYAHVRAEVEVVAACLALAGGELNRASRSLEELVPQLEQRGAFDLLPIPVAAHIRQTLGRGDIPGALAAAHRFLATVESVPFEVSAVRALPVVSAAMVTAGQTSEAHALLPRWARKLRQLDAPLASAALPHARGYIAAATGRRSTAARHFLAAAEQYDRLHCPYEAAQAREQAAAPLLGAADGSERERGKQMLQSALATYHRLGASWDAGRAASLARQHGISLPSVHRGGRRSYGTALSPQERKVAELAASGQTNKEIAAELFLSVNTVKRHITTAMRKLEVRSRATMAGRLAQRP